MNDVDDDISPSQAAEIIGIRRQGLFSHDAVLQPRIVSGTTRLRRVYSRGAVERYAAERRRLREACAEIQRQRRGAK